jgi:hypothetical protein
MRLCFGVNDTIGLNAVWTSPAKVESESCSMLSFRGFWSRTGLGFYTLRQSVALWGYKNLQYMSAKEQESVKIAVKASKLPYLPIRKAPLSKKSSTIDINWKA